MPVNRDPRNGQWRYRKVVRLPDGRRVSISGTPNINTKVAAEADELAHIQRVLASDGKAAERKEVPTGGEFFRGKDWKDGQQYRGQFWLEHVKPSNSEGEQRNKRSIYEYHLATLIGDVPLDEIRAAPIRAALADDDDITMKYANNVLAVLSKMLSFAVDERVIADAPRIKFFKVISPEIDFWDFDEYARILASAEQAGPFWFAGVCAAGEGGLRSGEVKALDWKKSIDLTGESVTVEEQLREGKLGPPKSRRIRSVPMTPTLNHALRRLEVVRTGYVVRNPDGSPLTDRQALYGLHRIIKAAGLPWCERPWHRLRHTFATHAALLGVSPWLLQAWLGHSTMDMTQRYVHVAQAHRRVIPAQVLAAGEGEPDPGRRILRMLGGRCNVVATEGAQILQQRREP